MAAIRVQQLRKVYRVQQKPEGLGASLRSLFKREYKWVTAVDDISFEIEAGEMVGFLGPNGAGKTTTLKMLSGLIYPSSGEVEVLGFTPARRQNEYRCQFALLMGQKNQLWWDLPAAESFQLHKEIYSIEQKQFDFVLNELTTLLDVEGLIHQPVRELSLGERMKMELIAALLHSPKVIFLDEPTIGLDVVAQANIRKCLREYNREKKVTILLTSHYMQDIEALCDHVIVINRGRIVHNGALTDIFERHANHKLITLRFKDGHYPEVWSGAGDVIREERPNLTLRFERQAIAKEAATLLSTLEIEDLSIEDPPIEEIIAHMYHGSTQDA